MSGYDGPGIVVVVGDTEFAGLRIPLSISLATFQRASELLEAGVEDAPEIRDLQRAVRDAYAPRDGWSVVDDAMLIQETGGGSDG